MTDYWRLTTLIRYANRFVSDSVVRLLETHHVDKNLEGKLKCLIFIPIISQTYCDPKSFAWQHEFCAFNSFAVKDQFGRDIILKMEIPGAGSFRSGSMTSMMMTWKR